MLTDPFIDPAPKYSTTSTGIRELDLRSLVNGALALVDALADSGWTVVLDGESDAIQSRSAFFFGTNSGSGTPVDMTAAECTSNAGPNWNRASIGSLTYNAYDPYRKTPTCPGGTGTMRWYQAGATTADTAANLAAAISGDPFFDCSYLGDSGGYSQFSLTSKAVAFENDEIGIFIGGGDPVTTRGYYTLRSPTLDGQYLDIKIQTRTFGAFGPFHFMDGALGGRRIIATITASGGGTEYVSMIPAGLYYFCGCESQFVLWPRAATTDGSYNNAWPLLVAMVEPPAEHDTLGIGVAIVSADNGDVTVPLGRDQLRKALHWSSSLGCGHTGAMTMSAWRTGSNDGYHIVSLLVRGTKGGPTRTLAGQPLIQAPYIAAPDNPRAAGGESRILGKLWDIMLTSEANALGQTMMHDGKKWTCFSRTTLTSDVGASMWILSEAS